MIGTGIAPFSDMVSQFPDQYQEAWWSPFREGAIKPGEFNLPLFKELNEAYRSAPVVVSPPAHDRETVKQRGRERVEGLNNIYPLDGARVLEIGCGNAEVIRQIAQIHSDSEVVGVDPFPTPEWRNLTERNASVEPLDIAREDYSHLGRFDFVYSFTVWEHLQHPYSALRAAKELLKKNGKLYLTVNLYRGSHASHLYREVFFPWPHLLFTDDVFEEFYQSIGAPRTKPAWVNKLTGEQYETYFRELGLHSEKLWYRESQLDRDFYNRFEQVLGKYPLRDLKREYLNAVLTASSQSQGLAPGSDSKRSELQKKDPGFKPQSEVSARLPTSDSGFGLREDSAMSNTSFRRYVQHDMEAVQGWAGSKQSVLMLEPIAGIQQDCLKGGAFEIGVHHGRFLIALHALCGPGTKSLGLDIFEHQERNVDRSGSGDLATAQLAIQKYAREPSLVDLRTADSLSLTPRDRQEILESYGAFRFVSVDGGHTREHVVADLFTAAELTHPGGLIIIDDWFHPGFPGVTEGYFDLVRTSRLWFVPLFVNRKKLVLCHLSYQSMYWKAMTKTKRAELARFSEPKVVEIGRHKALFYSI